MSALVLGHRLVAYVAPFQVGGGQIRVRHTGCHSRRRPSFAHAATLPATTHHANPCVRALLETSTRSYPPYSTAPPARSYDWGGGLSVGASGQAWVKLHADVVFSGSGPDSDGGQRKRPARRRRSPSFWVARDSSGAGGHGAALVSSYDANRARMTRNLCAHDTVTVCA